MSRNISYETQTQSFSTFGDKLLQHTDILFDIQNNHHFKPITIQLGPTELCDSDCAFCSVANRDTRKKISYDAIVKGLTEFKMLGAKSIELTGGGNPLLYKDGNKNINDIISACVYLGYKIGIITNSENLSRHIKPELFKYIDWIRISLIKLDEGKDVDDYNFEGFDISKLGFSYIIYENTTVESIKKISRLVNKYKEIKFVRIAADCLTEDSLTIKEKWVEIIKEIDSHEKFFIKEINDNFHPYLGSCTVGMIRPYWVYSGVYICTSHVLKHRNYHPTWKLCDCSDILSTWCTMNEKFKSGSVPYDINMQKECDHCYYYNNNRLLDSVIKELPDKDFA